MFPAQRFDMHTLYRADPLDLVNASCLAFWNNLLSQLIKCIIHLIGFIVNSFVLYFYVTQNLQLTSESISQLIKHSIAPNVFDVNLFVLFFHYRIVVLVFVEFVSLRRIYRRFIQDLPAA